MTTLNELIMKMVAEELQPLLRERVKAVLNEALPAAPEPEPKQPSKGPYLPRRCELMRGATKPARMARAGAQERQLAEMAWDALHENGHFISGRATRDDLTSYLRASFPGVAKASFSTTITRMIHRGVLKVVPPGF